MSPQLSDDKMRFFTLNANDVPLQTGPAGKVTKKMPHCLSRQAAACLEGRLWLPFAACREPAPVRSGGVPRARWPPVPWVVGPVGQALPSCTVTCYRKREWPPKADVSNIGLPEHGLVFHFKIVNRLVKDVMFEQKMKSKPWLSGRPGGWWRCQQSLPGSALTLVTENWGIIPQLCAVFWGICVTFWCSSYNHAFFPLQTNFQRLK